MEEIRTCAECQAAFISKRVSQTCCSKECYNKRRNKKRSKKRRMMKEDGPRVLSFREIDAFIERHRKETGDLLSYGQAVAMLSKSR